jgi:ribose-phosphate pyrophosphokinase
MTSEILLLSFDDQATPAGALAAATGLPLALVRRHRFPDGELRLQLPFGEHGPVPHCVVVYRSLHQPNEKLVELMLLALQARAWGVQRILLVAPYLAYMRQDVSFHPGEVISQRQVGAALAAWFDGVCTVDPHLHRVATLAEAVPTGWTDTLSAAPLLAEHIAAHIQAPLLIGPDSESAQWVSSAAQHIGCEHGVCSKQRLGDREVEIELPLLGVNDRHVVLLDDMASSGRTLAVAARQLLARGASQVDVAVTHALFNEDALDTVYAAGVQQIWSTDSVIHASNAVSLAPLLAGSVQRFLRALPSSNQG